jgi:hypothetical protein
VKSVEQRVQSIMEPFARPWRWFCDGTWIVLEPPQGLIAAETMQYVFQHSDVQYVFQHSDVHTVEAVFRATPHPGIYLRFHLKDLSLKPRTAQKEI